MRVAVKGRGVDVSDEVREKVQKRFEKIGKQVSELAQIDIELSEEKNPSIRESCRAEATLFLKGVTLRSCTKADNMVAAVNECAEDLARQVKRHRDKRRNRRVARAAPRRGAAAARAFVAGAVASDSPGGKVRLLAGGNPQIPMGDGDAPVQAYIAAMPGWKSDVGRRLDALIVSVVPDVRKAVKWNSPFYGSGDEGWFLNFHCFTKYVKVAFFRGASLDPQPPGASKSEDTRYLDIHEDEGIDQELRGAVDQAGGGAAGLGAVAVPRNRFRPLRVPCGASPAGPAGCDGG